MIFVGLISNKDFRETIMEAVSIELTLDDRPDDFVASIREDMNEGKALESKGNLVINFGAYSDKIFKIVNAKLADSFEKVSEYYDTIDNMSTELSEDDMIDIGYCVSNFAYLIRALSKNNLFTVYVKSVIGSVKQQLAID